MISPTVQRARAASIITGIRFVVVAATFLSLLAPGVRNLTRRPLQPDPDESIVDVVPA